MDDLNTIRSEILKMSENEFVRVLLFGNKGFTKDMNLRIVLSSIRFIKDSNNSFHIFTRQYDFEIFFHFLYQYFM